MRITESRTTGSRQGVVAATAAVVLTLYGLLCVHVAVSGRRYPSPPGLAVNPPSRPAPIGPHPPSSTTAPRVAGPRTVAAAPLAITIPAIGVRSPLLYLGLNADGTLAVPAPGPHYNEAGWYRYSPTPGSPGPAVIVGHVDSTAEGPSVFFRLASLRPHDTVLITRVDGTVAVFTVDAVQRYPKQHFPVQLVYSATNRAALRLITCGGRFDRSSGHYVDNVVVLASLVRTKGAIWVS